MALEDGSDDGEMVGTGNDARVALLNRINDANDVLRADELQSINDDGSTEAFVARDAEGNETALTDETVVDEEADAAIEALAKETEESAAEPQRFKIKVNGKEMFLTQEELIVRAQKIEAADQYLAEASRLRQEQAAKAEQVPQVDLERQAADEDLELARAIQMGDEEQAVAAIRKLRQVRPSVSPDDISKTIDERLTFNAAIKQFQEEYSDILSDPVLNRLAIDTDNKLIAAGDKRDYATRYKDIGDTLRTWVKKTALAHAPAAQGVEKQVRKASVAAVPKAASQKSVSSVEEDREESAADIIAGIAKSRGGPQWMQGARH